MRRGLGVTYDRCECLDGSEREAVTLLKPCSVSRVENRSACRFCHVLRAENVVCVCIVGRDGISVGPLSDSIGNFVPFVFVPIFVEGLEPGGTRANTVAEAFANFFDGVNPNAALLNLPPQLEEAVEGSVVWSRDVLGLRNGRVVAC